MAFDFKKECKELYAPKKLPNIVEVPPMHFEAMHAYACECGYALDLTQERRHHEIYLSDARKVAPDKLKTVIRHPIRVSQQKQ